MMQVCELREKRNGRRALKQIVFNEHLGCGQTMDSNTEEEKETEEPHKHAKLTSP